MSSVTDISTLGLSANGLTIPRMADFQAALQQQWQAAFGAQVNLDPRSNNGQLINIMAERFALLAELLEAIYQASYPSGAEGVAVDNLLALQGLTRLAASATKTAPSPVVQANGVTLYGLVCYGDAGTVIPAGSLIADTASPAHTFATDAAITIGPAQNAVQTLVFNPAATSGSYKLTLTTPSGAALTTAAIPYNASARSLLLTFPVATGRFALSVGSLGSATFTLTGSNSVDGGYIAQSLASATGITTLTGSGNTASGIVLDFGARTTSDFLVAGSAAPTVTQGVQGLINALTPDGGTTYPFADVAVAQSGNVLTLSYGALAVPQGAATTAGSAVPLCVVSAADSLLSGTTRTNVTVLGTVAGQPAQGVGSATCTQTGPASVTAGAISVIQTPVSGWSAVTNPLDCITGTNAETDAEALARRASLVANQAQGPLAAILQRVRNVSGVSAAIAVANSSMASQQIVTVGAGASSGSFTLSVQDQTTAALPYNVTASALQEALRALSGYETASVGGTAGSGLTVDWGTSVGGQAVPMLVVGGNTTGVAIDVAWGRFPKSVEVVAQGGDNAAIAQAIFASAPAGLASYGRPVLTTTATATAGQASITVADTTGLEVGLGVQCQGLAPGTTITAIANNTVSLSAAALSDVSNGAASFGYQFGVSDAAGNLQLVSFSRPQLVQLFANCQLVTDTYAIPGDSSSGLNPAAQWSPAYVSQIQQAVKDAISAVGIGGTISTSGSGGVANSFRSIPGVEDVTLYIGTDPATTNTARINLAAEQVPDLELGSILVSYT